MNKFWLLPGIAVINAAFLLAQCLVRHGDVPEVTRYFEQGVVLLVPLAVWLLLRWRRGRLVLTLTAISLACAFVGAAVKRSIPGSRRYAQLQSCDWAAEVIRADWKGPKADPENVFSAREYHRPNRPVIKSQDARVVLLVGGRNAMPRFFGACDQADYVACDESNYKPELGFSDTLLARKAFGKRTFVVYRRCQ